MSIYTDDYNEAYDDADPLDAEDFDDAEGLDDAEESAAARARRFGEDGPGSSTHRGSPEPAHARALGAARRGERGERTRSADPGTDSLRSYSAAQRRKEVRTNLVPALSLLVAEGFRAFGTPDNSVVRVGLQAAPLALLPWGPASRGIRQSSTRC